MDEFGFDVRSAIPPELRRATPETAYRTLEMLMGRLKSLLDEDWVSSGHGQLLKISEPVWTDIRALIERHARDKEVEASQDYLSSGPATADNILYVAREVVAHRMSETFRMKGLRALTELFELAKSEGGEDFDALSLVADLFPVRVQHLEPVVTEDRLDLEDEWTLPSITRKNWRYADGMGASEDRILAAFDVEPPAQQIRYLSDLRRIGGPRVARYLAARLAQCPRDLRCAIVRVIEDLASEPYIADESGSSNSTDLKTVETIARDLRSARTCHQNCDLYDSALAQVKRHEDECRESEG